MHAMRSQAHTRERAVANLARRQDGVVGRDELLKLGFGRGAIQRRLAAGRLHVVHRGVYAVGHDAVSRRGRLMAAVLATGPGALLSHGTAAAMWGLRRTGRSRIEVTTIGRSNVPGIHIHRTRHIDGVDRATRDGLPVTSVARTLLDLAEVVNRAQLERAVDEAERRRLFDLKAMNELLLRSRGRRGLKSLRAVIANATDPPATRSELEAEFAAFCKEAGLPQPAFKVSVAGYEVDTAWPTSKLVIELDSWTF